MSDGRCKIFADAAEITAETTVREVNTAFLAHSDNRKEIIELYRHYRNKTVIENRTKEVRANINFKIGEARCLEAADFYKGHIWGEPIRYVYREKTQNGTAGDVIAVAKETCKKLDEWKRLCLPEGTDAKYLSSPINQTDVQI